MEGDTRVNAILQMLIDASSQASKLKSEVASLNKGSTNTDFKERQLLEPFTPAAGPMETALWNPSSEASGERRASPVDESGGPRNLLDSVFKAANGDVLSNVGADHNRVEIEAAAACLITRIDRRLGKGTKEEEGLPPPAAAPQRRATLGEVTVPLYIPGRTSESGESVGESLKQRRARGSSSGGGGSLHQGTRGSSGGGGSMQRTESPVTSDGGAVAGRITFDVMLPPPPPPFPPSAHSASDECGAPLPPAVETIDGATGKQRDHLSLMSFHRFSVQGLAAGRTFQSPFDGTPHSDLTSVRDGMIYGSQRRSDDGGGVTPAMDDDLSLNDSALYGSRSVSNGEPSRSTAYSGEGLEAHSAVLMGSPLAPGCVGGAVASGCSETEEVSSSYWGRSREGTGKYAVRGSLASAAPGKPGIGAKRSLAPAPAMSDWAAAKKQADLAMARTSQKQEEAPDALISKMDVLERLRKANEVFYKNHKRPGQRPGGSSADASAPSAPEPNPAAAAPGPRTSLRYLDLITQGVKAGLPPPAAAAAAPVDARHRLSSVAFSKPHLGPGSPSKAPSCPSPGGSKARSTQPVPSSSSLSNQVQVMLASPQQLNGSGSGSGSRSITSAPSNHSDLAMMVAKPIPRTSGSGTSGPAKGSGGLAKAPAHGVIKSGAHTARPHPAWGSNTMAAGRRSAPTAAAANRQALPASLGTTKPADKGGHPSGSGSRSKSTGRGHSPGSRKGSHQTATAALSPGASSPWVVHHVEGKGREGRWHSVAAVTATATAAASAAVDPAPAAGPSLGSRSRSVEGPFAVASAFMSRLPQEGGGDLLSASSRQMKLLEMPSHERTPANRYAPPGRLTSDPPPSPRIRYAPPGRLTSASLVRTQQGGGSHEAPPQLLQGVEDAPPPPHRSPADSRASSKQQQQSPGVLLSDSAKYAPRGGGGGHGGGGALGGGGGGGSPTRAAAAGSPFAPWNGSPAAGSHSFIPFGGAYRSPATDGDHDFVRLVSGNGTGGGAAGGGSHQHRRGSDQYHQATGSDADGLESEIQSLEEDLRLSSPSPSERRSSSVHRCIWSNSRVRGLDGSGDGGGGGKALGKSPARPSASSSGLRSAPRQGDCIGGKASPIYSLGSPRRLPVAAAGTGGPAAALPPPHSGGVGRHRSLSLQSVGAPPSSLGSMASPHGQRLSQHQGATLLSSPRSPRVFSGGMGYAARMLSTSSHSPRGYALSSPRSTAAADGGGGGSARRATNTTAYYPGGASVAAAAAAAGASGQKVPLHYQRAYRESDASSVCGGGGPAGPEAIALNHCYWLDPSSLLPPPLSPSSARWRADRMEEEVGGGLGRRAAAEASVAASLEQRQHLYRWEGWSGAMMERARRRVTKAKEGFLAGWLRCIKGGA